MCYLIYIWVYLVFLEQCAIYLLTFSMWYETIGTLTVSHYLCYFFENKIILTTNYCINKIITDNNTFFVVQFNGRISYWFKVQRTWILDVLRDIVKYLKYTCNGRVCTDTFRFRSINERACMYFHSSIGLVTQCY